MADPNKADFSCRIPLHSAAEEELTLMLLEVRGLEQSQKRGGGERIRKCAFCDDVMWLNRGWLLCRRDLIPTSPVHRVSRQRTKQLCMATWRC